MKDAEYQTPTGHRLFDVFLLNKKGYYISIQDDSIRDIQIEDTLTQWWVTGYIDIHNKFDFLEKPMAATEVEDNDNITAEQFSSKEGSAKRNCMYSFRNDGNDMLVIKAGPRDIENDVMYTMLYILNVHSVIDLEPEPGNKIKRLLFRDEKYHTMIHSNIEWSTADLSEKPPIHNSDNNRSIPTGTAIKYILTKTLGPNTRFSPDWDEGSDTIFYTSPANSRAFEDLTFLVANHVSSVATGRCKCFLSFDRGNRFWRLTPLTAMLQNASQYDESEDTFRAGSLQGEVFELNNKPGGSETTSNNAGSISHVPSGGDKVYSNYNLEDSSIILAFRFFEMNGSDNLQYLNTTPIHMHDNKNKRFVIKQAESSIGSIYKKMTDYVSNFPHPSESNISISMNIDPIRKYNTDIIHTYNSSNDTEGPGYLNTGINYNILKSILLSNAIEFKVPGESVRMSGMFFAITPQSNDSSPRDSVHDDKIYGQFLITSVVHRWNQSTYTNKIVGVKPYNYRTTSQEDFESYIESDPEAPTSVREFFEQPIK